MYIHIRVVDPQVEELAIFFSRPSGRLFLPDEKLNLIAKIATPVCGHGIYNTR